MTSRRQFLQAATFAALTSAARAARLKTLGVQLYTVRSLMPQKAEETLQAIHAIGYQEVEARWDSFDTYLPMIQRAGLKAVSMHLDDKLMYKSVDEMDRAVEMLKGWDFKYAVHPYVEPGDRGGADAMKKLAGHLNLFGEKCLAAGIKLAYHNHAFEGATDGDKTLFQTLIDNTEKNLVGFELDCFWLSVQGLDPVQVIDKLRGRVCLLHLKDKMYGIARRFDENLPPTAYKEVGSGALDWPAILKAAAAAKVEHYFVEQDQTPGDPVASLKESYAYLSKLNY